VPLSTADTHLSQSRPFLHCCGLQRTHSCRHLAYALLFRADSLVTLLNMSELEQTSLRLRYGSAQQRVAAWQKLVSLEEKGLDGEKVCTDTVLFVRRAPTLRLGIFSLGQHPLTLRAVGMFQVARSGLIPILVAMLEQSPSRRKTSVQNQAASLLMEAAGSDAGMVWHCRFPRFSPCTQLRFHHLTLVVLDPVQCSKTAGPPCTAQNPHQ